MSNRRGRSRAAPPHRRGLAVSVRFFLVLAVLVPALGAVGFVGWQGLNAGQRTATSLFRDHLLSAEATATLSRELDNVHGTALQALLATPLDRNRLVTQLLTQDVPAVDVTLAAIAAGHADDGSEARTAAAISGDWARFHALAASGALTRAVSNTATAKAVASIFSDASNKTNALTSRESAQAAEAYHQAENTYRQHLLLMAIILLLALLAGVGMVVWLIRSVLPRTLSYVDFAARIAAGDDSESLVVTGTDEIGDLGRTLQTMAGRRKAERQFEQSQLHFTDSLQVTADEHEAHDLLKRHLERSLPGMEVTVLNRNNSADRLEAVTALAEESSLAVGLDGAQPRSCLAVRFARPHHSGADEPLLPCSVCHASPDQTSCTPLLVSGQVIGSVLVEHASDLDEDDELRIRASVSQAAPVLGNLRNLAIAERRASTDGLTGLPNRRALQADLLRMAARASRSVSPLSALMIDLDHFKQINDQYGHDHGDEVLAGVGVALQSAIRASDLAGRWGGEEFIVLLPDTGAEGAVKVAESIGQALAMIYVDSVDRTITASIGVATIPDHAGDAEHLVRSADRALYTAKRGGRNRVEVASARTVSGAAEQPAEAPLQG